MHDLVRSEPDSPAQFQTSPGYNSKKVHVGLDEEFFLAIQNPARVFPVLL
jgi:hypothetical protein